MPRPFFLITLIFVWSLLFMPVTTENLAVHGYDTINVKTVSHLELAVLRILTDVTVFSLKF